MSIIQKIRDRAAWIVIGAIAVALIAFIVQDAFVGRGKGLFSGNSNVIGEINGTKVDIADYSLKLKRVEDMYTQQGYPMDDNARANEEERLWNQYVEDAVLSKEFKELGLEVTDREVGDILYGANPPQDFARQFTDPKTGEYDASQAYQQVQQLKRQTNSPMYKSFFGEYIPALINMRKREKYESMIANSAYVPKWLVEKTAAENSQISSINYVLVPYSTVNDSTVRVTDADIDAYVAKRKDAFKQETSRSLQYVTFSAAPSKEDSAAIFNHLESVKDSFARSSDENTFLQQEFSRTPYYASKISRKQIHIENIDSIVKNPVGSVYGPYLDQNNYVLAKLVSAAQWPDTVKVRHILIATQQQSNGQMIPVRTDDQAKKLADSIALAIKNGAIFDSLCVKYSDDPGSKDSGGVYKDIVSGRMVAPFNDFIFSHHTGEKGVVKTDYGYHYIEILSQKGSSPAYQIAYLSQPINATDQTVNTAMGLASQFAGESRNSQSFKANADKEHLNIFNATDIRPMDNNVAGLNGNARDLVRWLFREADKGDVSDRPYLIGDQFVVANVTQINKEGVKSAEAARPLVEYKIRNNKKAKEIISKAGNPASLDALSQSMSQPVSTADSLSFARQFIPNLGQESRVIGASFHKDYQNKLSGPLVGEAGVFYLKINNISAVPNPSLDIKTQQEMMRRQLQMTSQRSILPNLIKSADIVDKRYKFY